MEVLELRSCGCSSSFDDYFVMWKQESHICTFAIIQEKWLYAHISFVFHCSSRSSLCHKNVCLFGFCLFLFIFVLVFCSCSCFVLFCFMFFFLLLFFYLWPGTYFPLTLKTYFCQNVSCDLLAFIWRFIFLADFESELI